MQPARTSTIMCFAESVVSEFSRVELALATRVFFARADGEGSTEQNTFLPLTETGCSSRQSMIFFLRVQLLGPETRKLVLSTEAPYTVNRQVVFRVRGGGEHRWTLRKKIMDCLELHPVSVKGRNVFCSVEPSPSARAKNTLVAKACSTLENSLTTDSAKHMTVDVRAGCIYHIPNPGVQDCWTEVGRATRTGTWQWLDAAPSCWPEPDLQRLRSDTGALVSE